MNSKLKNSLSSPVIIDKQLHLVKYSTIIQTYVEVILQQPDLKLDALPKLPDHQKVARKHGENWNAKVLPLTSKTVADVIDFANEFDAFYDDLVKYAKELHEPQSRKKFVEGLQLLKETVTKKEENVSDVVKELTTFGDKLRSDNKSFLSDEDTASVKIIGDSGELAAIHKEINSINDAINTDLGFMGGGGGAIALGAVMIVVGAFTEIPTGGASTALVAGGLVCFSGGIAMQTAGCIDYAKKVDQLKKISEEASNIQAELLALQTAKAQLTGFVKALSQSIMAASQLKIGWQALNADLQELINAIKDVHPDITTDWLLDELKRAQADWKEALEQAKRLQPDGKLPVKHYKDIMDAFKKSK